MKERDALEVAKTWKVKARTVWTDSFRLENGKVGRGRWHGGGRRTRPRSACEGASERGVDGQGIHLGTNKEVFDVEVPAIHQALKTLDERNESGAEEGESGPPDKKDDGEKVPGYEGLDLKPCQGRTPMLKAERRGDPQGPPTRAKGAGRKILPAAFRPAVTWRT